MFQSRILWRLYGGFVAIILISTLIVVASINRQVTTTSLHEINDSLSFRCELLAEIAKNALLSSATLDPGSIQETITRIGKSTRSRLTIIDAKGWVVADSEQAPEKMDNHGSRPEVVAARNFGWGNATRYSDTVHKVMMYRAYRVMNGDELIGFARASLPTSMIDSIIESKLTELRTTVLWGASLAALVSLLLGYCFSRQFSNRITNITKVAEAISLGDYNQRINFTERDEIGKLADAFNRMALKSQRRMSEITAEHNRLEEIFAGIVEGVIHVDQQQNIMYINQAASRLLGISMTLCINRPIWEKIPIREIIQALEQVIENPGSAKAQMRTKVQSDNRVIDIYAAAITHDDGSPNGAVIVLHDISELDRLLTVRRDFVANASHELKTPITAIRGLTETILDDEDMDPLTQRRFTEKINAQSLRLSSLVTALMTLSRLESDQPAAAHQLVNLVEIVQHAVSAAMAICLERQLTLDVKLPAEAIWIAGEPHTLSQLVDNLLNNAVKYTPKGGYIDLNLSKMGKDIILTVEDSGIGIDPDYQQRVFERFYRVDKARSRDLGGTGLGLAIVKNIVDQLEGEIILSSEPGVGSKFVVTLPSSASPALISH